MTHLPGKLSYPVTTVDWDGKFVNKLPEESYLPLCRILKEAGINEVMISGYVTVEEASFDMMEESKRLGGLLESMGMRPAQHHGLSPLYAPPDSPQEPVVERLIRSLRYTANMNSPVLVVHPAFYFDPESWAKQISVVDFFKQQSGRFGAERILETAAANLHEAAKEAEKLGVKIAVENNDRFEPMGRLPLLKKLIELADSPMVGLCLDSGHCHCAGLNTPVEWIEAFGTNLFTTHFHDNRGVRLHALSGDEFISPAGIDEHLPPGFGTIPWIDVIQALRKTGYSAAVNFESGGWSDGKEGYEAAVRFWRTCEKLAEKELKK